MAFRRGTGKATYKTARARAIRAQLKADAKRRGLPCARCGRAIDYDAPYWRTSSTGRRRVNPAAFVAGHRVDDADGGAYELTNLQPECGRCSITSGARTGQRRQQAAAQQRSPGPRLSLDDW